MTQVVVSQTINAPLESVWNLLENFGNLDWAPGIERLEQIGEGVGMIRRIYMPELAEPIDEQLESMDPVAHTFSYTIPRGIPMPVTDYRAWVAVEPLGDGACRVIWSSEFTVLGDVVEADAQAMVGGAYQQMLVWIGEALSPVEV